MSGRLVWQNFRVGDLVRVRHFDDIDTDDIGDIPYSGDLSDLRSCYDISESNIEMHAGSEAPYVIATVGTYLDSFVYRIGVSADGPKDAYWWAQGMLAPYEEENLPEPEDLSVLLSPG